MARRRKGKGLVMQKIREVLRLVLVHGMGDREIGRSCAISHVTVGKYRSKVVEAGLSYSNIAAMEKCPHLLSKGLFSIIIHEILACYTATEFLSRSLVRIGIIFSITT